MKKRRRENLRHRVFSRRAKTGAPRIRQFLCLWLGALALAAAASIAIAGSLTRAEEQLNEADAVRLSDYGRFSSLVRDLGARSTRLDPPSLQHLRYLEGWKDAYDGNYATAIRELESVVSTTRDQTLRFRAQITAVNVLIIAARYEQAFVTLADLLKELPEIRNGSAREQALFVAGELYNAVGQYDLGLYYGKLLERDNWRGLGVCKGPTIWLEALFKSGKLTANDPSLQSAIDTCLKLGLPGHATSLRTFAAQLYLTHGRPEQAIGLLQSTYAVASGTRYPRLISEYDALLAQGYLAEGDAAEAREFALKTLSAGVKNAFTEPVTTASRILYKLARQQGDSKAALEYHEEYTAEKLGYLNDLSARQLAYEKVTHENLAKQLEIQALSRQNRVLELERRLAAKEVEATRLYGVILTLILAFIGLWALLTKRSQLHFKKLSRLDGLTGISNRLHFIECAEAALAYAKKSGQEVSLALFDLDYFKSINDRFGHATGDFVLRRTVEVCKEYLRRSDIFGRFGGEEFSVLLPGCGLEAARERAEQLRQTINGVQAEQRGEQAAASASFGIASSAVSGYELSRLLAHADAALYRAKRAGRNRVMAYDTAETGEVKVIVPPAQA